MREHVDVRRYASNVVTRPALMLRAVAFAFCVLAFVSQAHAFVCGNTIVEPGEECDDGNVADGDGCSSTCLLVPVDCGIPTGTWHLAENSVLALIEDGECSISGVIYASDNPGGATLLTGTRFNSELTLVAGSTSFSSTFTAPDQINFANSALFTKVSSSLCGDSVLDAGEDCDDGNFTNGDGCTVACDLPGCGNHVLEPDEACDDGNQTDGDGCTTTCTLQTCGNGVIEPGEDCDDANHNNGDGCSAACRFHACGNSVIEPGEECDDGNMADGDGCSSTCLLVPVDCGIVTGTWHQAGNSVMALIEDAECNISGVIYATNNPGGATMLTGTRFNSELTLVAGSTSFLSTFRAPDQINFANSALFTKVSSSLCGDSVLDVGEDCDDGNFIHTDTCNLGCRAPGCGNGIPDADEDCDDGNRRNGDGCNYDCSLPQCGNNIVDPNEQCDDGNLIAADGCDDLCGIPGCPNSAVDVGEECDDGNLVDNDACARNCTFPRCGNYIWEAGEYCDEGVGSIACDQDCTAPFDGFKCYGGKDLANPEFTQLPVSTSDQLVPDETLELTSVKFVCTMTEMNGGEINQASSLICYRAKGTTLLPRPTVEVSSQFEVSRFELKKPHLVCVPGTISSLP